MPWVRRFFSTRTQAMLISAVLTVVLLAAVGLTTSFVAAILLLAGWCMVFAVAGPMRQAFMNGLIPTEQRATVLSFDNLMGSAGGVVAQPGPRPRGRRVDYGTSYVVAAGISALSIPFIVLAHREHAVSDPITSGVPLPVPEPTLPGA